MTCRLCTAVKKGPMTCRLCTAVKRGPMTCRLCTAVKRGPMTRAQLCTCVQQWRGGSHSPVPPSSAPRSLQLPSPGPDIRRVVKSYAELGTRQHCRDNVTMFSGQNTVDNGIMSSLVVAPLFRHSGLSIFSILSRLCSYVTLWRCLWREAKRWLRAQLWSLVNVTSSTSYPHYRPEALEAVH